MIVRTLLVVRRLRWRRTVRYGYQVSLSDSSFMVHGGALPNNESTLVLAGVASLHESRVMVVGMQQLIIFGILHLFCSLFLF